MVASFMKSIEYNFEKIRNKNPYLSDYICLTKVIESRDFKRRAISGALRNLVDKDDYSKDERNELLDNLVELSRRGTPTKVLVDDQKSI